ncbi:three-prime repair exonuclease 1 isoform X2 [Bombus bifarius]|uniref:Three-prime repair exonuclease 1 isoform X2 n=1 Tax=Bombus bifarius TaxID=103933 RepID=A0A6P8N0T5_9HYME|nr:three-prime repair exonuclease 1 isoform X2 [Bombus bifarius]
MIKTFIFLDLETTGLITKNYMPKITEMSLIAVSRTAICDTTNISPRVLQKLVLPIHPNVPISKDIQTLTGLSNENLKEFPCFNCDIYNLVLNFINRLAAPACFIAYNGNNYDYPIFLSEFKNIEKNFSENVLSIDMMHLVKEFFSCKQNPRKEMNIVQPIASSSSCTEDRRGRNVRRQLDFTNSRPINFRLSSVYKHIFGNNPEDAHSAEGDCLTMIRCAIKLGNFFVEWTDCNAVPLTNYTSK